MNHIEVPLVSIALSVYNGEKCLNEQLDSLLQQTYPNIEIIAVDDCSTDSSLAILKSYEKQHDKIKVYSNEKNLGFNKSFEKAFGLCSGKFIAISDQDDVWLPQKIEILKKHIQDNLLIYSNSLLIDEEGNELGRFKFKRLMPAKNDPRIFSIRNTVSGHTVLFRKELLNIALPIPPGCYYDWWMALIASNESGIISLDQPLTRHRIHLSNASKGQSTTKSQGYISMSKWIEAVLSIKNLRSRDFFDKLYKILSTDCNSRDRRLILFQLKNQKVIYNKKDLISRFNSARKIVLSLMRGTV